MTHGARLLVIFCTGFPSCAFWTAFRTCGRTKEGGGGGNQYKDNQTHRCLCLLLTSSSYGNPPSSSLEKTSCPFIWISNISQLKIVLLGGRNSGKSSVGNLILGKEEFVTKERTSCSRRLGVVAGRWITVVDTPGWWCDFSAGDTSQLVKREIVSSVSLCPPGPHVFLIVIKASSAFSERRRRAVEEHVALLGDEVWSHCMVVFTSADRFLHKGAEECVERGGAALRRLTEKCGQRSHSVVLNEQTEGAALLLKIQNLMSENGNRAFEVEESISQAVFTPIFVLSGRLRPITNIRIVLLGAKGSGKTSALNTILSRECHRHLGRTARCQVGEGREMVLSPSLCPPGPHVFLLTIRVDRAFTETHRRSVQEHVELISEHIWSRVILLFTFGDWLGATTTEQYIESEGTPLQWLVDRCSDRYHVLNSRTKGEGFQVRELIGKIEETMSGCCSSWHYEIEMKVLLILVGGRKVGKSSCGNTILSTDSFGTFSQTTSCTEKQGHICGKKVSVLDTPGCLPVTSDLLTASCAILLVVNISSSFTDLHRAALEKQLEDGGSQMWKKTMVLFSHGDWLGDTSTEQRIEGEGGPLQGLVERCGNRYHVLDNKNWGDGAQVRELLDLVEEMDIPQSNLWIFECKPTLLVGIQQTSGLQRSVCTLSCLYLCGLPALSQPGIALLLTKKFPSTQKPPRKLR
uniref:Si:ch211-214j24.15 n=1 Tax=Oryzias latipes TaxID=8090 RepID=A0A3P9KPR0_ORYLA